MTVQTAMPGLAKSICRIIAGPNGAGKTTFALTWLREVAPGCTFVNADLIAAGLSPLAPERQQIAASRLFLREIDRCRAAREPFAFETTLAGRGHLRLIQRLRSDGWRVELTYLALPSAEMSRIRVMERVRHGGHDVPPAEIRRRFPRSLRHLFGVYGDAVDTVACWLNSGPVPQLVYTQQGRSRIVHDSGVYESLKREAKP